MPPCWMATACSFAGSPFNNLIGRRLMTSLTTPLVNSSAAWKADMNGSNDWSGWLTGRSTGCTAQIASPLRMLTPGSVLGHDQPATLLIHEVCTADDAIGLSHATASVPWRGSSLEALRWPGQEAMASESKRAERKRSAQTRPSQPDELWFIAKGNHAKANRNLPHRCDAFHYCRGIQTGSVTAPRLLLLTRRAYLPSTPVR